MVAVDGARPARQPLCRLDRGGAAASPLGRRCTLYGVSSARYLGRVEVSDGDADHEVVLPYGLTASGTVGAIRELHAYLHAINSASVEYGYGRLEDFMQPAGFSGLVSNVIVRAVVRAAETANPGLALNRHPNGRPDVVPRAVYPGDAVKRGSKGIEVKASRYRSGWQGHNAEPGWLLIVQFDIDTKTEPIYDRTPTNVSRIMCASLDEKDWTFSGRREGSRRTPTASINPDGLQKLEAGTVYSRQKVRLTY